MIFNEFLNKKQTEGNEGIKQIKFSKLDDLRSYIIILLENLNFIVFFTLKENVE